MKEGNVSIMSDWPQWIPCPWQIKVLYKLSGDSGQVVGSAIGRYCNLSVLQVIGIAIGRYCK